MYLTNEKESKTVKIIVFLDGESLFSLVDNVYSWKHREKISIARNPRIRIDVDNYPPVHQSPPKTVESKVVARIEMKNKQSENVLCILCYELVEPTRNQIVQDIIKIKQELST